MSYWYQRILVKFSVKPQDVKHRWQREFNLQLQTMSDIVETCANPSGSSKSSGYRAAQREIEEKLYMALEKMKRILLKTNET